MPRQHIIRSSAAVKQDHSLLQHTAVRSVAKSDEQPAQGIHELLSAHFHHNFSRIPVQTAPSPVAQPKPDSKTLNYQIKPPKHSSDGYREITAVAGSTNIGRVKIKGLAAQGKMEMASLWVDPAHRRQGISKSLITAATTEGKRQGYRKTMLGVAPEAPGMSTGTLQEIYTRQGFKKTGARWQGNPLMERNL